MKKIKTLAKRGVSMLIAGMMCVGMMPTNAFAAGDNSDDFVFVYVNVTPETVSDAPTFSAAEEEKALEDAKNKVETAQKEVNDAKVNGSIPTLDGKHEEAVSTAKGEVSEALDKLEHTQPTFGDGAALIEDEADDETVTNDENVTADEIADVTKPANEEFADGINSFVGTTTGKVNNLNEAQKKMDSIASSANESATEANKQQESDKAELSEAYKTALSIPTTTPLRSTTKLLASTTVRSITTTRSSKYMKPPSITTTKRSTNSTTLLPPGTMTRSQLRNPLDSPSKQS